MKQESVMAANMQRVREDSPIRDRVATLAQAIRDKDIDALMTHYAPDVVVYDVTPPLDVQSAADYRKNFEKWFASMLGPIDYEMSDVRVSMSDSHAFCHALGHIKGAKTNGDWTDYWVRVTTCFQKANGQWLVGHEHVSMPAAM
jgi:ketosteroid isomerase-like protein